MKQHPLTTEEKADQALESLEGIQAVEPSAEFDAKMFARFDCEFSEKAKTPKWFWVAALAIFSINMIAVYNYSFSADTTTETSTTTSSSETKTSNAIVSYYFQGGTDWYQQ